MPQIDISMQVAEQRVRDLRKKIELRKSQANLPVHEASAFGRGEVHLQNLYRELSAAAAVVIGKFDPLEVLDKMGWS